MALLCEHVLREHIPGSSTVEISRACASLLSNGRFVLGRGLESGIDDDGDGCEEEDSFATFDGYEDWMNLGISIACVFCAALAAGLTMSGN